jgi:hypothetical protein
MTYTFLNLGYVSTNSLNQVDRKFESVTLIVDSLYAKPTEGAKSRAALSVSTSDLL